MDQVEKYIMSRLYKSVFCPEITDDEKNDLAIQERIRCQLYFGTHPDPFVFFR